MIRTISVFCVVLFGMPACSRGDRGNHASPPLRPAAVQTTASAQLGPTRPPPGRWRLTGFHSLHNVTLRISHILIRHKEVEDSRVSLSLFDWYTQYPGVTRDRIEAWQLAERVARRAQQNPGSFAALAREVSEDPTTRERGGELGTVMASQLWNWPTVLDALAATSEGRVSEVVETEQGFHVFLRQAPAPERKLSGARILLTHTDAPFAGDVAVTRQPIDRSRAEALKLSAELYQRLRDQPTAFPQLVRDHSNHVDAERGGDFGTWSTREATPLSRQVAVLATLQIGQVSAPIETVFGIEIIMRTADPPRPEYAADTLQFPFQPDDPASQLAAKNAAEQAAARLAHEPRDFETMQRERHPSPLHVISGRDTPALEQALARLELGRVSPQPVLSSTRYLLLKRLPSSVLQPNPPPVTELPNPGRVELSKMVRYAQPAFLQVQFQSIAQQASTSLGLDRETSLQLIRRHDEGANFTGLGPDAREQVIQRLGDELRQLLGTAAYEKYQTLAHAHLEQALMSQR
ncbi:MAG TPA: peptidylprolyl isomerase [Polyangiaceae bacterium]|nr:peptidylprolyl isomerase [Polyangiaceae bacterium]